MGLTVERMGWQTVLLCLEDWLTALRNDRGLCIWYTSWWENSLDPEQRFPNSYSGVCKGLFHLLGRQCWLLAGCRVLTVPSAGLLAALNIIYLLLESTSNFQNWCCHCRPCWVTLLKGECPAFGSSQWVMTKQFENYFYRMRCSSGDWYDFLVEDQRLRCKITHSLILLPPCPYMFKMKKNKGSVCSSF